MDVCSQHVAVMMILPIRIHINIVELIWRVCFPNKRADRHCLFVVLFGVAELLWLVCVHLCMCGVCALSACGVAVVFV